MTSNAGFSVVAPISVIRPSSTAGSSASCWALLKRWISSRKKHGRPAAGLTSRSRAGGPSRRGGPLDHRAHLRASGLHRAQLLERRPRAARPRSAPASSCPSPAARRAPSSAACPARSPLRSAEPSPSRWDWPDELLQASSAARARPAGAPRLPAARSRSPAAAPSLAGVVLEQGVHPLQYSAAQDSVVSGERRVTVDYRRRLRVWPRLQVFREVAEEKAVEPLHPVLLRWLDLTSRRAEGLAR